MSEELSLQDKMNLATDLAFEVTYSELSPTGGLFTTRDDLDEILGEETAELAWSWADGLYQKWFHDHMNGRCSLQAMIDFDMEREEKRIDEIIEKFRDAVKKLPPQVKLSVETMRERGYKY